MSSIIKNDVVKKISMYLMILVLGTIGTYLFTITLQFIFNIGKYIGTFLRCLYSIMIQMC